MESYADREGGVVQRERKGRVLIAMWKRGSSVAYCKGALEEGAAMLCREKSGHSLHSNPA